MNDRDFKYIIYNDGLMDNPILFPKGVSHDTFARSLFGIVSAGFVRISDSGEVTAYGKSVSLGVPSRKEDSAIIAKMILR